MTLTFTGYDQSPEFTTFVDMVKESQGWCNARYRTNATIELTAHVPEQPELLNEIQPRLLKTVP